MENEHNYNFDLPALLKLSDLDIRKVAKDNPLMPVGEYYNLLEKFSEQSSKFLNTINKIISLSANEKDIKNLTELKQMMHDIGCNKIISLIEDIISISKRGHSKSAAGYAKTLLDDLQNLISQIMETKKPEKAESEESQETQVLSKVIKLMEYEDATRKMRILAVDDAPSMIQTIASVLEGEYKVHGLTNPAMVEKFLQQITPDLFLLDYQMPEINGFDLVPVIRKFKEHKDTPVIFLTSLGTIDHVSAAYALGACDFIVKPFEDTILQEKVAKHIVRKKLI